MNGHLNCVSFLVNFGVNLWALNNDFHTAKDCAAISQKKDILDFLDQQMSHQSALNPKMVQKQKEKSLEIAEKNIDKFKKLQKKATKKAEKEEKSMEKFRKKLLEPIVSLPPSLKRGEVNSLLSVSGNPKFSEIVNNNGTVNKTRGLSGVSRKVLLRKQQSDCISNTLSADFKVPDTKDAATGKRSIRSLTGLRRDDVLYVRRYSGLGGGSYINKSSEHIYQQTEAMKNLPSFNNKENDPSVRSNLRNLFLTTSDDCNGIYSNRSLISGGIGGGVGCKLHRTVSEPDFLHHIMEYSDGRDGSDEGIEKDSSICMPQGSIFERPGFGSVAFRHSILTTPNAPIATTINGVGGGGKYSHKENSDTGSTSSCKNYCSNGHESKNGAGGVGGGDCSAGGGSDSIGSAGSLAQRNATLSVMSSTWDEDGNTLVEEQQHIKCDSPSQQNSHTCANDPGSGEDGDVLSSPPIVTFLAANGFTEYIPVFRKEKIDLEALILLTEQDLKSLGMPLGPRRKLMSSIERRKLLLREPGTIKDTIL
ncbi:SAM_USH1G_HARP domain-containing protein Sans isoform X2 [Brevipalpus obovatus]